MVGVKGKSGPPGNQNAFRHGLAGISDRELTVRSQRPSNPFGKRFSTG
jgi:hypothetical protein